MASRRGSSLIKRKHPLLFFYFSDQAVIAVMLWSGAWSVNQDKNRTCFESYWMWWTCHWVLSRFPGIWPGWGTLITLQLSLWNQCAKQPLACAKSNWLFHVHNQARMCILHICTWCYEPWIFNKKKTSACKNCSVLQKSLSQSLSQLQSQHIHCICTGKLTGPSPTTRVFKSTTSALLLPPPVHRHNVCLL